MLISTITCLAASTWPGRSDSGDGSGGMTNWTYLAPNTVVDAMSTSTFAGIAFIRVGSIARWIAASPLGNCSIESTLPTWTPRICTLASGFITSPARGDTTVTGTLSVNPPRNRVAASTTTARSTTTVTTPISGRSARPVTPSPFAPSRDSRMDECHHAPTDVMRIPPVRAATLPPEQVFGQLCGYSEGPRAGTDVGNVGVPPSIPLVRSANAWDDGYYLKIAIIGQWQKRLC